MSSLYSQGSAGSTSDLSEPGCESSANANLTSDAGKSSPDIGPESTVTPMLPDSTRSGWQAWDSLNDVATDLVPTMGANTGMATGRAGVIFQTVLAFAQNQRDELRILPGVAGALAAEPGMKQQTYPLTSYAEVSPAKTSQLPENEPVLPEKDRGYSMKQPESLTLFSDREDGSSLRMYPDCFPAMEALTSGSYSRRWPTSGFTTSPGELWTADTSECHNGGGEFSSLPDVLQATVPKRFYLSQKAAAGILRRAEKRGKALPKPLESALRVLSGQASRESGATEMTSTTTEPMSGVVK